MSRLGLRSEAGPFDWYFSDFDKVLECIDTDFVFFMKPENMNVAEDNPKAFVCSKYNFYCNHDIENDLNMEKDHISEKYHRRADRFILSTKEPTIFFRAVRTNDEVKYINSHTKYINSIVKKYNSKNEICFILLKDMDTLDGRFLSYRLSKKTYYGDVLHLRTLFWLNEDLIKFSATLIDKDLRAENIKVDRKINKTKVQGALHEYLITQKSPLVYQQLSRKCGLKMDRKIYIWGVENKE